MDGEGALYRINELARFRILVGGIAATSCISTFYVFNIISRHMQDEYGFSAGDLTIITTTGVVVGFFTFPGGLLLDYAGPMYVCMIAVTMNMLGALLFGLVFKGVIAASVLRFSVFFAILHLGCSSFDTGALMAVMGSFPRNKGSVVAIMKTLTGLGASILALINYSFFRTDYAGYMFFIAGVVLVFGMLAVVFIRFPPYHLVDCERKRVPLTMQLRRRMTQPAYLTQRPPMQRFYLGFVVIICLLIYLTTQSLIVGYVPSISDSARLGITIGAILLLLCLSLVAAPLPFLGGMDVPYSTDYPDATVATAPEADEIKGGDHIELDDGTPVDGMRAGQGSASHGSIERRVTECHAQALAVLDDDTAIMAESDLDPQYQGTFWQDLRGIDLWLCFWNTLATWGCGIVVSFNSAQIYRALNDGVYEKKTNTMYAAIIGVGSGLGRMSMGLFEAILLRFPSDQRPVVTIAYPVASICMCVGLVFLLALPLKSKAIIIGLFFDAFGNGFSMACTALTIRTIFAKDIGKHYNFMFLGALIAVIGLNRFGFGELYNRQAEKNGTFPDCAGKNCVQTSFLILLAVNSTAIIASTLCHIRYRCFVHRCRYVH